LVHLCVITFVETKLLEHLSLFLYLLTVRSDVLKSEIHIKTNFTCSMYQRNLYFVIFYTYLSPSATTNHCTVAS